MTDTQAHTAPPMGPPEAEPPWACLCVEHETRYEYSHPVDQAHHMACLRPLSDAGQTLESFDLTVWPTPSQRRSRLDSAGVSHEYFAVNAPHRHLRVLARSQVRVRHRFASSRAQWGGLAQPTCRQVRECLRYQAQSPFEAASEYAYASPFVPLHEPLREYAASSLQDDRPIVDAALDLMRRIHEDFDYAPTTTDISTPILDVLLARKGVCQDFAHLMLGCLRASGLAARYVSGYLLTQAPPGQAPLVGADASHAWCSVWVPGLGLPLADDWLDLDPTNNCVPGLHHVRVAHGRDFGDVTPLRGVIRGGGEHTLLVHVTTRLLSACTQGE